MFSPNYSSICIFIKISLCKKNYFSIFLSILNFSAFFCKTLSYKTQKFNFYEWLVKCKFWPYWTAPNITSTSDFINIAIIMAITQYLIKIFLYDFNLYNLSHHDYDQIKRRCRQPHSPMGGWDNMHIKYMYILQYFHIHQSFIIGVCAPIITHADSRDYSRVSRSDLKRKFPHPQVAWFPVL